MAKKDKKSKSAEKKARVAEKTQRKTAQKEKKASKKPKTDTVIDADDQDIDSVLAEYAQQQALFHKVTEAVLESGVPPVRSGATLTASPEPSSDELFLFGGETFNGSVAHFFNDLCIYNTSNGIWRKVTSPNSPLPRSGHWVVPTQHAGGTLWLFGGEFSSPKQNTFYHYSDFWSLSCKTREWSKVDIKGKTPPARSGHRMVAWKNYVILWGGFQDTSASTKYLADLWVFDVQAYTWTPINLPAHAQRPDARSSFTFLPHDAGAVLFGGYSKTKVSAAQAKGKKAAATEVGNVHEDTWLLRMDADLSKIRWERRKKPANTPQPKRVGVTMAYHKGRGIMFGGVHDAVETDENLDSVFFNELYAWSTDRNRFFPLILRKPRHQQNKNNHRAGGGRRDRGKEAEQEMLELLAKLEGRTLEEKKPEEEEEKKEDAPVGQQLELSLTLPAPRFHAALAVQNDTLYIYGGTIEKGEREIVYNDLYSINLEKLDGVRTHFSLLNADDWVDSESEDDEDDEGEDDEDDSEDEEEEDEDEHISGRAKAPKISEAELERLRAEKVEKKRLAAEAAAEAEVEDEKEKDPTPMPRPFESLRDFFERTGNDWQNHLIYLTSFITNPPERTIKELRYEAFKMAEKKWWEAREEMRAAEDEMEEAGIGEVVELSAKGGSGATGGAKRR